MGSVLFGLQSLISDQLKDRTRSRLRLSDFGVASSSPAGPNGPEWYDNTVDWLRDHTPGLDKNRSADAVNEKTPKYDVRQGAKNTDDYTPAYDVSAASRNASEKAPKTSMPEGAETGKAYASGAVVKGQGYQDAVNNVHDAMPKSNNDGIDVPETNQIWARGYGSRINQDATVGYAGYIATIGGAVVGWDKRYDHAMVGLAGGYAQTIVTGNDQSDGTANTGHGAVYFSMDKNNFYFDANLNYAFNSVDTEGNQQLGYTGSYNAQSLGFYVGGGYGISMLQNSVLFTPEVSFLSSYYDRASYLETSSQGFPDKQWDAYDQWSYLSSLGATISSITKFESDRLELEIQPEVRVHWLHEFNAKMDDESYTMVGGANNIGVSLQAREEDLIKIGAGIRFSKWQSDTTEFGLDLDGVLGDSYAAYVVSGKVMHRF